MTAPLASRQLLAEKGREERVESKHGPNRRRGDDIADRLLDVGAGVVALSKLLPRNNAGRHIALQLLRAGTSAGANYAEARAAESRSDFVHKVRIAAKEMREALFWLQLVRRSALVNYSLDVVINEADELVAILMASAKTARASST